MTLKHYIMKEVTSKQKTRAENSGDVSRGPAEGDGKGKKYLATKTISNTIKENLKTLG